VAHLLVAEVERRQRDGRVEPVDRLHQVEHRLAAEHRLVRAGGDQAGMGHVATGQGRQHPHLAPHHVVALRAQVPRSPPKHERLAATLEPQQHVLRPAGQRLDRLDRAGRQPLAVHPRRHRVEVDPATEVTHG
jgi:hypothetical protein